MEVLARSLKIHTNVIIKKSVMLLLLVNSQISFGRQCKIKQHCVLWVYSYAYNIQNLGVISFLSYVYFKWFSVWMLFLSDPLLLALTSLSFYSLMLTLPQPANLFVSLFSSIIPLFLYGCIWRWYICSIFDFVPTCCTSLLTHSLSLHSNICDHVYEGYFRNSPLDSCCLFHSILIFWSFFDVNVKLTQGIWWLLSPQSSFLSLLISFWLVSLVQP